MKKITLGMAVFLACSYSAAQRSSSSSSSDLLVAAAFGVAVGSLLSANNGVDNQDALRRDAKAKLEEAELQGSVQVLARVAGKRPARPVRGQPLWFFRGAR